jgi:DNA end-binding protein Ku
MARSIWKGAISFSLIHIPVSLHPASRADTLDLDLLDRRDFSPVGYQRVNKSTGKVVDWDDIVKGYEYRKGEYVVLTDEDFRRANVEATRTIAIQSFVRPHEIPPQYFDTPYYLAPGKGGGKVYALLREALRKADRWAIGSAVVRTRAYACALMPHDEILVLNTLRYPDELLPGDTIEAPAESTARAGVTQREMDLAIKLVEDMSETWDASRFEDTYRHDLLKRIEEKARKGQAHALTEREREKPARRSAEVIDLTALLKRSLEAKTARPGTGQRRPASAQRRAAKSPRRRRASRRRRA